MTGRITVSKGKKKEAVGGIRFLEDVMINVNININ